MTPGTGKIFSLREANEIVPVIAELTADVVEHLDAIRRRYELDTPKGEAEMPEAVFKEVEQALTEWSDRIQQLGASPKGYFTVDFQSLDPEMLYCWTYGEEKIQFTHKVWENFAHRKPLSEGAKGPADHLRWIN